MGLSLPLTDRTGRPGRRVGYGSSEWAFETENNHRDLLDEVNDPAQRFGSYQNLIHLKDYRFRDFYKEQRSRKQ